MLNTFIETFKFIIEG